MPTDADAPAIPAGWTRGQRRLHWWIAGLVFAGFALGWLMVGIPLNRLLLKFLLYQLHKTIGLTVLALAVVRLGVLLRHGRPAGDPAIAEWQRRAAGLMHGLLYAGLFAVPVLGYLTAATSVTEVPTLFLGIIPIPHVVGPDPLWFAALRSFHRALAILLVALACAHALVAGHHHILGRTTLARMWRG